VHKAFPRKRLRRSCWSARCPAGDPVTFDGEFYHVDGLDPAAAPAPRVFTGSVGPKSLAVTGQLADGWIPPGGSDWLGQLYRESRPGVDAAASAAGRNPAEIASVFNFGGRITAEPLAATRGEDGRWIGGSVQQWIDELTIAVLGHHAAGFIYRRPDDTRRRGLGPLGRRDRPRRPRSNHAIALPRRHGGGA
jgi:alkanesulfonate monooxygenase SsuD/methylene tetrahydromethanopterin reductase-like flavin-dependent oxidoreductase (luciferase family)